jgi:hypothetical protein
LTFLAESDKIISAPGKGRGAAGSNGRRDGSFGMEEALLFLLHG